MNDGIDTLRENTDIAPFKNILNEMYSKDCLLYTSRMRKEDLRLAAGLTTNMIANMGKGKHISMDTLTKICETLDCGILDVIELVRDEEQTHESD